MRVGHTPDAWRDDGPAVARFHGPASWGTRNAAVINDMVPVVRQNLRTPEPTKDRDRRYTRELVKQCAAVMPKGAKCARRAGHKFQHRTREAMDREAIYCRKPA